MKSYLRKTQLSQTPLSLNGCKTNASLSQFQSTIRHWMNSDRKFATRTLWTHWKKKEDKRVSESRADTTKRLDGSNLHIPPSYREPKTVNGKRDDSMFHSSILRRRSKVGASLRPHVGQGSERSPSFRRWATTNNNNNNNNENPVRFGWW